MSGAEPTISCDNDSISIPASINGEPSSGIRVKLSIKEYIVFSIFDSL